MLENLQDHDDSGTDEAYFSAVSIYCSMYTLNCRQWLNWYSGSLPTARRFWIRLRKLKSLVPGFNLRQWSEGEMFGKISRHKIPLSTDTREMVKAGKYVEESDVISIWGGRHQPSSCKQRDTKNNQTKKDKAKYNMSAEILKTNKTKYNISIEIVKETNKNTSCHLRS